MRKQKKQPDYEDDGRVIAPMNVEGMPWYARRPEKAGGTQQADSGAPPELTRGENLAFVWGVMKAVLLVAAVFILVYLGFILFCTEIWLK